MQKVADVVAAEKVDVEEGVGEGARGPRCDERIVGEIPLALSRPTPPSAEWGRLLVLIRCGGSGTAGKLGSVRRALELSDSGETPTLDGGGGISQPSFAAPAFKQLTSSLRERLCGDLIRTWGKRTEETTHNDKIVARGGAEKGRRRLAMRSQAHHPNCF